jgi:hypothetical protein
MRASHFFLFYELSALGCGNSFLHRRKKMGFFIEVTGNNICH